MLSYDSTRDAYYVASTFAALNFTSSTASALCSKAKDQLTSPDLTPETAFFASNVVASLGCGGLDQVAVELVKKELGRTATLPEAYRAISTLVLLKEHGVVPFGVLSSDTADEMLINLKDLIHEDGSFRYKKTDTEGSASAAGMVYEVLAGAKSLAALGAAGEAAAAEIIGTVGPLFSLAEERAEGMLEFIGEDVDGASANLVATARVLRGAAKLAAALEGHVHLPSEVVSELAAFVLSSKVVLTTSDAFHLTSALAALAGPWLTQPVAISLATPALSPSAMTVEVHLTNVMGKPAAPCTLLLLSALQDGEEEAIYRDVWLTPVETGFVMDFATANPEMGVYELILKAVQTKSLASSTAKLQLLVRAPAALSNVVLQVRDTDKDASSSTVPTTTAKFPDKAPDSLSLRKDQQLLLAFSLTSTSGKPFVPHQAMVRITRKAREAQLPAYFLATPSSNKGFAIKAPVHDIKDQLGVQEAIRLVERACASEQ
ncbi:hypothetical protein CYMTET_34479 [Cymbomonas tetramitiformis]|uniref:Dolichyl-diphosphooligosaccharide--protein glycosyltransferase subunit 2 n=1 Tax=Cymbomonas tetramitiformis TaxID=36881 RepID=A0AAE0FBL5_9CHLO|nr:hypothetical protein CYMTET_34479 [Cymbomonas tetramitiformis]